MCLNYSFSALINVYVVYTALNTELLICLSVQENYRNEKKNDKDNKKGRDATEVTTKTIILIKHAT